MVLVQMTFSGETSYFGRTVNIHTGALNDSPHIHLKILDSSTLRSVPMHNPRKEDEDYFLMCKH